MHFKEAKGLLSAQNGMNLYRGCTQDVYKRQVLFRIVLEQADNIRQQIGAYLAQFTWAILIWLVVLCGLAALVTLLLRWEPLIGGSGIPQVEGELRGGISQRWWRVLLAKFTGGVLAIGAGPVSYTHLSCHPDHQIMP